MIDYRRIAYSVDFYKKYGFEEFEVPWFVAKEIVDITIPKGNIAFSVSQEQWLVGSAEQSFLQLAKEGVLPSGKYQAVTPCFRNEKEDSLHFKYFMKNELIFVNPSQKMEDIELERIIYCAVKFFKSIGLQPNVIETKIGFDVEHKGIELGSYGIRECKYMKWIYGTGCAEPRTSIAKSI